MLLAHFFFFVMRENYAAVARTRCVCVCVCCNSRHKLSAPRLNPKTSLRSRSASKLYSSVRSKHRVLLRRSSRKEGGPPENERKTARATLSG